MTDLQHFWNNPQAQHLFQQITAQRNFETHQTGLCLTQGQYISITRPGPPAHNYHPPLHSRPRIYYTRTPITQHPPHMDHTTMYRAGNGLANPNTSHLAPRLRHSNGLTHKAHPTPRLAHITYLPMTSLRTSDNTSRHNTLFVAHRNMTQPYVRIANPAPPRNPN